MIFMDEPEPGKPMPILPGCQTHGPPPPVAVSGLLRYR